jgi:hypothetical protein
MPTSTGISPYGPPVLDKYPASHSPQLSNDPGRPPLFLAQRLGSGTRDAIHQPPAPQSLLLSWPFYLHLVAAVLPGLSQSVTPAPLSRRSTHRPLTDYELHGEQPFEANLIQCSLKQLQILPLYSARNTSWPVYMGCHHPSRVACLLALPVISLDHSRMQAARLTFRTYPTDVRYRGPSDLRVGNGGEGPNLLGLDRRPI